MRSSNSSGTTRGFASVRRAPAFEMSRTMHSRSCAPRSNAMRPGQVVVSRRSLRLFCTALPLRKGGFHHANLKIACPRSLSALRRRDSQPTRQVNVYVTATGKGCINIMFRALDAFFVRENNKTDSMEEAAPQPTWLPDEPAVAAGRLRVLVADSVASDRFSLGAILRRIEPTIEILEAPNGAVAERLLRERNVDIGFIDRRLPGFDGREVQNWASTSDSRSMFVLVSDRLVPKWSEIATLINAYEVMLKPFNESHVENLLKVFWRLNRRADVLIVDRSRTARKIIRDMLERIRFNFRVDETRHRRERAARRQ